MTYDGSFYQIQRMAKSAELIAKEYDELIDRNEKLKNENKRLKRKLKIFEGLT